MDDTTTISEAATSTDDKKDYPLVFLHGIGRRFTQGDATLDVLKGAELAVWAGQSVALVAPSGTGKSACAAFMRCSRAVMAEAASRASSCSCDRLVRVASLPAIRLHQNP